MKTLAELIAAQFDTNILNYDHSKIFTMLKDRKVFLRCVGNYSVEGWVERVGTHGVHLRAAWNLGEEGGTKYQDVIVLVEHVMAITVSQEEKPTDDSFFCDSTQARIEKCLDVVERYGSIDGAHHKQWVIDQMLRALLGAEGYVEWLRERNKEPENYADWDHGTPP